MEPKVLLEEEIIVGQITLEMSEVSYDVVWHRVTTSAEDGSVQEVRGSTYLKVNEGGTQLWIGNANSAEEAFSCAQQLLDVHVELF